MNFILGLLLVCFSTQSIDQCRCKHPEKHLKNQFFEKNNIPMKKHPKRKIDRIERPAPPIEKI